MLKKKRGKRGAKPFTHSHAGYFAYTKILQGRQFPTSPEWSTQAIL